MAFRTDINAVILATLSNEPMHGYEIVRRIREAGGAGKLSEGQIYPYLHKLEEAELVVAEWQTDTGGAPRRVYRITESGSTELATQRENWRKFVERVGSIMSASPANLEAKNA